MENYEVRLRVKYSDCSTWITIYRSIKAKNEYEARVQSEKIVALEKNCEWVKAKKAYKWSELMPF